MTPVVWSNDGSERPVILVAHPTNEQFLNAKRGLVEELGSGYDVKSLPVTGKTTLEEFIEAINLTQPQLMVLMDVRPMGFYRLYQDNLTAQQEPVPALALMALYLDRQLKDIRNATGILYEIPGLITVTQLRGLLLEPTERVGVIYRAGLREFFEVQKELCLSWKIELVGYEIPERSQNYSRHIRKGLRKLLSDEKVDALWVFNDPAVLSGLLLKSAWIPLLDRYKPPVVVSVPQLITDKAPVGHLAVVPDPFELGVQAGELVVRIQEQDWQPNQIALQNPISVRKLLNLKRLDDSIEINQDAILEMDRVEGRPSDHDE